MGRSALLIRHLPPVLMPNPGTGTCSTICSQALQAEARTERTSSCGSDKEPRRVPCAPAPSAAACGLSHAMASPPRDLPAAPSLCALSGLAMPWPASPVPDDARRLPLPAGPAPICTLQPPAWAGNCQAGDLQVGISTARTKVESALGSHLRQHAGMHALCRHKAVMRHAALVVWGALLGANSCEDASRSRSSASIRHSCTRVGVTCALQPLAAAAPTPLRGLLAYSWCLETRAGCASSIHEDAGCCAPEADTHE